MFAGKSDPEAKSLSQQQLIGEVHDITQKELVFTAGGFYCDFVENPESQLDERVRANCGPYAARSADLVLELSENYRPYIFIVNSHTGALAVSKSDVVLINSDTPGVSRANVEQTDFLDQSIYEAMRNGVESLHVAQASPLSLINKHVEPLYQAWAYTQTSSVAILKWPNPGHDYLMLHSRMRKIIKGVLQSYDFENANIDLALNVANQLRPIDLTIDNSVDTYQTKRFYNSLKKKNIFASYPGNEKRLAIKKYAKLATSQADLQKVIELTSILYRQEGLIAMDSDVHRQKLEQTYKRLDRRAQQLGRIAT